MNAVGKICAHSPTDPCQWMLTPPDSDIGCTNRPIARARHHRRVLPPAELAFQLHIMAPGHHRQHLCTKVGHSCPFIPWTTSRPSAPPLILSLFHFISLHGVRMSTPETHGFGTF